jgi:hypothetical protein
MRELEPITYNTVNYRVFVDDDLSYKVFVHNQDENPYEINKFKTPAPVLETIKKEIEKIYYVNFNNATLVELRRIELETEIDEIKSRVQVAEKEYKKLNKKLFSLKKQISNLGKNNE